MTSGLWRGGGGGRSMNSTVRLTYELFGVPALIFLFELCKKKAAFTQSADKQQRRIRTRLPWQPAIWAVTVTLFVVLLLRWPAREGKEKKTTAFMPAQATAPRMTWGSRRAHFLPKNPLFSSFLLISRQILVTNLQGATGRC